MDPELINFADRVRNDLSSELENPAEVGVHRAEALTRLFIDELIEDPRNAPFEDGEVAHYQSGRMRASGFCLSDAGDRLDLFVTLYRNRVPPETVPPAEVRQAFAQLGRFVERVLSGSDLRPEQSMAGYDMARKIRENREYIQHVQLHLFTDGIVRDQEMDDVTLSGRTVKRQVWDIQRLHRHRAHLHQPQSIVIDLQQEFGQCIPCLKMPAAGQDYEACLTIIPGHVLAKIYARYGMRLLERNVRAFLQAGGGVNKGIRQTIRGEPGRFLAYNNGISATASSVDFVTLPDGRQAISRIHNLQIVNGGQTTASLHRAMVRDRADLGQVHVQAKISIVDTERMSEMVPLISRYANSQNKIDEADLAANDVFHVRLEQLSHVIWSPVLTDGHPTLWYYERARGQYRDAEAQKTTPAQKRQFRTRYPASQRLTKVDVAKFINTWDGLPDVVSRGNQKNFAAFTVRMSAMGGVEVDRELFEKLVALALLFREVGIMASTYQAYKANIIVYTIAWLAERTERRLDLDRIWREQRVPVDLIELLGRIMTGTQQAIVTMAEGNNVTEWCKKPQAWTQIRELDLVQPDELRPFLANADSFVPLRPLTSVNTPAGQDVPGATGSGEEGDVSSELIPA